MPRLLDYLQAPYGWLAALDPSLPRALFVALIFAIILAWRKLSPDTWLAYSTLVGDGDEYATRFQRTLRNAWQSLPSVLIGAFVATLGTGGDLWPTLKLALLGLAAPLVHELATSYQGGLARRPLTPEEIIRNASAMLVLVVAGFLHGCAARVANPCSEVTLATITAGCEQRIELECHGDPDCPVYLECSRARKTWQACP